MCLPLSTNKRHLFCITSLPPLLLSESTLVLVRTSISSISVAKDWNLESPSRERGMSMRRKVRLTKVNNSNSSCGFVESASITYASVTNTPISNWNLKPDLFSSSMDIKNTLSVGKRETHDRSAEMPICWSRCHKVSSLCLLTETTNEHMDGDCLIYVGCWRR